MARSDLVQEVVVLPRAAGAATGPIPEKVRQLPPRAGKAGYVVHALRAARALGPFDVVFCGHLFAAPLAAAVARFAGAQYWQQLHGIEAWSCPGRIVQRAVEGASLVTAVSRHTRRLFLSWARNAPESVKVLPNTVDERFHPGPKPAGLLARHGLTGKTVLLTVSRLAAAERYKGHDRVIRALAQLLPTHPDLVYVIAGDGDDRHHLEELAGRWGCWRRFASWATCRTEDLPDLYRTADVFVMPSTGEGFGIVFLQALGERSAGDRGRWRWEPRSVEGWKGRCDSSLRRTLARSRSRSRPPFGRSVTTRPSRTRVSAQPIPGVCRGAFSGSRSALKRIHCWLESHDRAHSLKRCLTCSPEGSACMLRRFLLPTLLVRRFRNYRTFAALHSITKRYRLNHFRTDDWCRSELRARDLLRRAEQAVSWVPGPLYPAGGAAGPLLLYLLIRILSELPIKRVLELGAGRIDSAVRCVGGGQGRYPCHIRAGRGVGEKCQVETQVEAIPAPPPAAG